MFTNNPFFAQQMNWPGYNQGGNPYNAQMMRGAMGRAMGQQGMLTPPMAGPVQAQSFTPFSMAQQALMRQIMSQPNQGTVAAAQQVTRNDPRFMDRAAQLRQLRARRLGALDDQRTRIQDRIGRGRQSGADVSDDLRRLRQSQQSRRRVNQALTRQIQRAK